MANELPQQPQRIIVTPTKSMGIAILLAVIFGPAGMLYSTIPGGLIMIGITFVIGLIGILTAGFGLILLIPLWPVYIIWAAVAANSYNKKLLLDQKQF